MHFLYTIQDRLVQFFTACSYGKTLENYIVSKNPQHPADVEFFTRQFQYRQFGGLI